MILGKFTILNGKLWATMQTAKAHHALVFYPDRPLVVHFNGIHRALFDAQTTSDTSVLYAKMSCAPYLIVIDWLGNPFRDECRGAWRHITVCTAFFDAADNTVDFSLGIFGVLRNFFRGGKVKDRGPCICHLNRIIGIYFSTLNCLICYCT